MRRVVRHGLVCTLFAAAVLASPPSGAAQDCLSSNCHGDLLAGTAVHAPVAEGNCTACHRPLAGPHPGQGYPAFETPPAGKICLPCHEGRETEKHALPAKGECLACHAPHGGSSPPLLQNSPKDLCLRCHGKIEERIGGARIGHAPIFRPQSCLECHDIHGGGGEKRTEAALCLSCHGKDDYRTSTPLANIARELEGKSSLHGPAAQGKCSPCHDPHGSRHFRLLTGAYPDTLYAPFTPEAYGICFQCHDADPFVREASETRFRNGDVNLHLLHTGNPEKGRSCRACHAPHASGNAHLLRQQGSPFGQWRIPLVFTSSPQGGRCAPGCHQPASYDRTPMEKGPR